MSLPPGPTPPSAVELVLRVAGRPGPSFALDPAVDNVLGRSPSALVVLADRLASRAHAALTFDAGQGRWMVRDLGSRNGTWLDGVRITDALLDEGALIRVGTSEFLFRRAGGGAAAPSTERHVRRGPPDRFEAEILRHSGSDDGRWPMLLYQASIRLLSAGSPGEIVATALELAAEFTAADTCGWFRLTAAGDLEPVCVVPPGSDLALRLDDVGADAFAAAGEAAWCGPTGAADVDVACAPLVEAGRPHAMLAASAVGGTMRNADFEILVALASLAAAACAGRSGRPAADWTSDDAAGSPEHGDGGGLHEDISDLAASSGDGGTLALTAADLRDAIRTDGESTAAQARIGRAVADTSTLRLEDWQKALVAEALRRTGGSVPNAAAELGISRATLYRKLEAYGLTRR